MLQQLLNCSFLLPMPLLCNESHAVSFGFSFCSERERERGRLIEVFKFWKQKCQPSPTLGLELLFRTNKFILLPLAVVYLFQAPSQVREPLSIISFSLILVLDYFMLPLYFVFFKFCIQIFEPDYVMRKRRVSS